MYCVGLTGNIASGKSTALGYFEELGVTCLSADAIAREITSSDPKVLEAIHHYFGNSVLLPNGQINRPLLRNLIFSDPQKRLWLENLTHPLIKKKIQLALLDTNSPYCVIEIPLLFDKKAFPYINRILLLSTEKALQIARIRQRDNSSKEEALKIINTQPNETTRKAIADDLVNNSGDLEKLKETIKQLHAQYLSMAN